jgi:biotin carboxyl carrier protein
MAVPLTLKQGAREYAVTVEPDGRVRVGDWQLTVLVDAEGSMRFKELPGTTAWAIASGDVRWVFVDGRVFELEIHRQGTARKRGGGHHGSLSAPMPATVLRIDVAVGDRVQRGDTLIILEAMKMELPVKATAAGKIEAIKCQPGELVQPGTALIEIEEEDE